MRDVRNAEFKRGERRQRATHYGRAELHIHVVSSARDEVRDKEGRVKEDEHLGLSSSEPSFPKPQIAAPKSTDWHFSGGGLYDGQEVLSIVNRYLRWLREDILPTAERLTTGA